MADEALHHTLDELIRVLNPEEPGKEGDRKDLKKPNPRTMPAYQAGWSDGWDACKYEVMKIIGTQSLKDKRRTY
jgi:hypothetical protein